MEIKIPTKNSSQILMLFEGGQDEEMHANNFR